MPPFLLSESLPSAGKPNYIGMKRTVILYEDMLWRNGEPKSGKPLPESIAYWVDLLRSLNYSGLLVLDIEHWPIYTDPTTRQYMVDIINAFKVEGRKYQVGYYAMVPQRNSIESLLPGTPGFLAWKQRNDFVQPIADAAEVLFPSLYTLHPDQLRWNQYIVENVKEARRLAKGKKIYAFLWPQYHPAVPLIAREYLDQPFWKFQLEEVRRLADGAILWREADGAAWNEEAPWLKTVRQFMLDYSLAP